MALLSNAGKPVLILSLDKIEEVDTETAEVISAAQPDVTDAEREEKKSAIERFLTSDSFNKKIRIPIFITDAIEVQQVGSNSGTGKTIDYINNEPIFSNFTDNVSVELKLKNSVGDLSVASDAFSAIIQRLFSRFDPTSARASFFGESVCIFNGFLTGVNRTTVAGTNEERMNLTFERQKNQQEPSSKEEKKAQGEPTQTPVDAIPPIEGISNLSVLPQAVNNNAGGSAGDRLFSWYQIASLANAQASIVPQIFSLENVNRIDYQVLVANSKDFNGNDRQAITVLYDGVYIPLGLNGHYPYYKPNPSGGGGYAVTTKDGWLYLGLESVS